MTQSNTPAAKTDLTPQQVIVMKQLMTGKTVTDAAKSANVSRETVHRWLREDWSFQAALNQAKRELVDAVTMRMIALANDAVDTVAEMLDNRHARTALEILKGLGILHGERIHVGPTDPELLREVAEVRDAETQAELNNRELLAGIGGAIRQRRPE